MLKPLLHSLVPPEVITAVVSAGQPAYRGGQLLDWLYRHPVREWDGMSNLPAVLRTRLAGEFDLWGLREVERQVSRDGTRKFLFELRDGETVESVIIPMSGHATFCISSQVGCAMACRFCATARGGLVRDLEPGEIVQQVLFLQDELRKEPVAGSGDRRPNIVFMGMGEPLDNFDNVAASLDIMQDEAALHVSRRRIQLSTSGPREGLLRLLDSEVAVDLTISLGGTDPQARRKLMPVPGRTPPAEVAALAGRYADRINRKVTVAWVLIAGRTDAPLEAERLADLLAGGPFKVNLIPMNSLGDDLERPAQAAALEFQRLLQGRGLETFIRASGGQDIDAACGQLRRRRLQA